MTLQEIEPIDGRAIARFIRLADGRIPKVPLSRAQFIV